MQAQVTAIVQCAGDWWIGWVEEIPGANGQERTTDELLASLREAVNDILKLHDESIPARGRRRWRGPFDD